MEFAMTLELAIAMMPGWVRIVANLFCYLHPHKAATVHQKLAPGEVACCTLMVSIICFLPKW